MTDEKLERAFQDAWEEFGDDVSTDFLISITASRCGVEPEQVVLALFAMNEGAEA